MKNPLVFIVVLVLVCAHHAMGAAPVAELKTPAWEAAFSNGMLRQLKDVRTGQMLIDVPAEQLSTALPLFGPNQPIDLTKAKMAQQVKGDSVNLRYDLPGGAVWRVQWSIEEGTGDLLLKTSATTPQPVAEMRVLIPGASLSEHTLVWIHAYGVGHTANAPWTDQFLGDPVRDGAPGGFLHPLVGLFEGATSGWVMEGRDPRVGPASLLAKGNGAHATLGFSRLFPVPTATPEMYEIRIRTYQDHWEDAIDPYRKWLETDGGYLPLDQLPPRQAWAGKLKTQAYVPVGNYEALEELAKIANPAETLVGRQGELRNHAFDVGYPDYSIPEAGKAWVKRAREMGFHVGMHFNSQSLSVMFPDLVQQMRPAMNPIGKDAEGNDEYEHIYPGPNRLYRVSSAYKPWRETLIKAIKEAVDAGIDVIYLDESMTPGGKFVVDGVSGVEGVQLLMKEILEAYPHVVIETEQFNLLTGKYGKIALSQMPLGHPLSGYIFKNLIKVVPEGVMYSPTSNELMDAYDVWGFMLPGGERFRERSATEIVEAFHKYKLEPDSRLPRAKVMKFVDHYSHGQLPVVPSDIPEEGLKLFGYRGENGVTAYFERHRTRRGLVVYEPGKEPQWFGTRITGTRSYRSSGAPAYFGYRQNIVDWLVYDDENLLGLDPEMTYWIDTSVERKQDRFHLFEVPEQFATVTSMVNRTLAQEVLGEDDIFILRIAGKGRIGAYVPEGYHAYFDGKAMIPDARTRQAFAEVDAGDSDPTDLGYHIELAQQKENPEGPRAVPSVLLAFKAHPQMLEGPWTKLRYFGSEDELKWIAGGETEIKAAVGAIGRIVGKLPEGRRIRLVGSYELNSEELGMPADGVLRVNGKEVLRIPHGERPYPTTPFDVDISAFAGQDICLEFVGESQVRGNSVRWIEPTFVVEK